MLQTNARRRRHTRDGVGVWRHAGQVARDEASPQSPHSRPTTVRAPFYQFVYGCRGVACAEAATYGDMPKSEVLMMAEVSIRQALGGEPAENETVTIKGWVRTRRDSKGGFSFVAVND